MQGEARGGVGKCVGVWKREKTCGEVGGGGEGRVVEGVGRGVASVLGCGERCGEVLEEVRKSVLGR